MMNLTVLSTIQQLGAVQFVLLRGIGTDIYMVCYIMINADSVIIRTRVTVRQEKLHGFNQRMRIVVIINSIPCAKRHGIFLTKNVHGVNPNLITSAKIGGKTCVKRLFKAFASNQY